jgi:hypothetical protein
MKKYIIQHSSPEQAPLLEISSKVNKKYADKYGFDYISDVSLASPEKGQRWEKLSFLNKLLPTIPADSLVVWEDVDCLNLGNADITTAFPADEDISMCPIYGGSDNKIAHPTRKNAGVILFKNTQKIKDLFKRIYDSGSDTDETGFSNEFKKNEIKCATLDSKWNCWTGNAHLCKDPVVVAFHGRFSIEEKIQKMLAIIEE